MLMTFIMPSSKEGVSKSPMARDTARASITYGNSAMSCVASTMMVVRVSVMRVMPPSIAADPITAMTPTSGGSMAPTASHATPKIRPMSAPMAIPETKLPEGSPVPKRKTEAEK
jgi:hypothetical protein